MKISSVEQLSSNRFLNLFRIAYRDRDNRQRSWELVSRLSSATTGSPAGLFQTAR